MKTRLKKTILLSFMLLVCNLSATNIVSSEKYRQNLLPDFIKTIIKDSLKEYVIPDEKMFDSEWKSYEHITRPMFAFSDFNGDKEIDYAIILLSKNHRKTLLCVFLSNKKSYSIYRIRTFNLNNDFIDVFISIQRKGYWKSVITKHLVKYDGITVDWASESLSFNYYWDKSQFVKFLYD